MMNGEIGRGRARIRKANATTRGTVIACVAGTLAIGLPPSLAAPQAAVTGEQKLVPLPIVLPQPMFAGTPLNLRVPGLEKPRYKARDPFPAWAGVVNVALRKQVTGSESEPVSGDFSMVADWERSGEEGGYTGFAQGKQYFRPSPEVNIG